MRADTRRNSQNPFLQLVGPYLPVLIVSLFIGVLLWGIAPEVYSSIKGTLSSALQTNSGDPEGAEISVPDIEQKIKELKASLEDGALSSEERERVMQELEAMLGELDAEHASNGMFLTPEEAVSLLGELNGISAALEDIINGAGISEEDAYPIAGLIQRIGVIARTFESGIDSAASDMEISALAAEAERLTAEIGARVQRVQHYNWLDTP